MSALASNINRYPVTFAEGRGVWLTDTEGERYLDMLAGIAVCALGHSHPALTEALARQAGRLMHVSNLFYTPELVAAAEAIVERIGPGAVYMCNSGTEANEAAIKAARKLAWRRGQTERNRIVALEGSFHGRTYGSLAATIQPAKWEGFGPMPQGFASVPINDAAAIDAAIDEHTAAVIIEPLQGEGGIRELEPGYAQTVRGLCTQRGALLIVDEIQTGLGRTGKWWGFEHLGVEPDIVTLAKALGGGFPVGATWLADGVREALQPSDHSTTQGGGPLAAAAVLAVLETVEKEGLVERAAELGRWLAQELAAIGPVRGWGLLLAVELDRPVAAEVVAAALDRRLIVNNVTPSAVRVAPPLVISREDALEGVARLRDAIEAVGA